MSFCGFHFFFWLEICSAYAANMIQLSHCRVMSFLSGAVANPLSPFCYVITLLTFHVSKFHNAMLFNALLSTGWQNRFSIHVCELLLIKRAPKILTSNLKQSYNPKGHVLT
ncbi:hypothetical protein K503DRAFT_50599 [Rhizopogon vinicolor AM-OR11-026]|uniref:Secreted protein n=1 Tax=Rhizopogon vinicolor AM-OR11-026 TaxID=1314800 RepID=A0A1B7MGR1_9AGAM|nr:hypothetical protein K503DRAFT_50599 [Rhizopogon vinicolor AM-OR11-026]